MDILSWIISIIYRFETEISAIAALVAALTVVFTFLGKIKKIGFEFLIHPIKNFFNRFDTLHKRVAHVEKRLHDTDFKKIQDLLVHISGQVEDLDSQFKNLSRQHKKLEALQKSMLNISEIPTFETDEKGACNFANKAYLNFLKRPFEELKGYGWFNIIHPDDRKKVKDEWDSALEDNRNFELTFRVICKERKVYSVLCESHPLCGERDGRDGYIGHYYNVVPEGEPEEKNP